MNGCTCGPYWSVIPPEPCPIHDPARAYWRAVYLREFGGRRVITTINTATPLPTPATITVRYQGVTSC